MLFETYRGYVVVGEPSDGRQQSGQVFESGFAPIAPKEQKGRLLFAFWDFMYKSRLLFG